MQEVATGAWLPNVCAKNDVVVDPHEDTPRVAVLLCTKQGEAYLQEQLDSIQRQTHAAWSIYASDDGSEDGTLSILKTLGDSLGEPKLTQLRGPGMGFVANFLSLLCNPEIEADFYAFADQDDIWQEDKLERAVQFLQTAPANLPAVYCSRTFNVDASNTFIGQSPLFTKPPGFANALVQNIGGGNTMVLNHVARNLLRLAGPDVNVPSHDWWTYLLVAGSGGRVFYDPEPTVRYRQHGKNLVGANASWAARLYRIHLLFQGRFVVWTNQHLAALARIEYRFTPDNKAALATFARARRASLLPRLVGIKQSGVYRQTLLGNLGLVAAAVFRKI